MKSSTLRTLIPVLLIVFIDLLSLGIVVPVLTPIFFGKESSIFPESYTFKQRAFVYGLLNASYALFQFFGAPILGALSDRYGRKKMFLVSLIGTLIGNLFFGIGVVTKDLTILFLSRVLAGFMGGNVSIATSAVADISDEKSKSRNFGLVGIGIGLGLILGPFLGGKLSDPNISRFFTLSTPFWFATLLSFICVLLILFVFKETLHTKMNTPLSITSGFKLIYKAMKIPNLRALFTVIFLLSLGFNFFLHFFQVYLYEKFEFNESQVGTLFAYAGIWIAISLGILNSLLTKKFSAQKILLYSTLALSISYIFLLLPENYKYLYLILPFCSIFHGLNQPNSLSIVSNLSSEESQGEIMGINQAIQSLAQTIPPVIAGIVISIDIDIPILLAAFTTLIGWIIYASFFNLKLKKQERFSERDDNIFNNERN